MDSMAALRAAVEAFRRRDQSSAAAFGRSQELRELREIIDALEVEFSCLTRAFQSEGGHLADGFPGVVSWLRHNCRMSGTSAADRVCVGKEIESLPHTAEALAAGRLGYQSAAAICHLHEQVGERRTDLDEEALVTQAERMSVNDVRDLCRRVRYAVDPEGSQRDEEFNLTRRRLHISALSDGMHVIDGVLDPVSGAVVKTALEALATSGPKDQRKHSQRMADALVEMTHHAMDEGRLPIRSGARVHVSVSTTLESLRGMPGASEMDNMPISRQTLERMCCDCTVSRVMFADSTVIDVGRATRTVNPSTRRAVKARDKRCRWPGCDRPIHWTSPHHIEFWGRGGPTKVPNLLSLCWHHHRQVHEGGWQVVKAGDGYQFIPPQWSVLRNLRARGPVVRWAAA